MSKPMVGKDRIGERFVALPSTLTLKTSNGTKHVIGKIEQLTPPSSKPVVPVRLTVSAKQVALFNRQVCVRWAWKLTRGGTVLAISPIWYASKHSACRAAARFADYLLAEPRVEVLR